MARDLIANALILYEEHGDDAIKLITGQTLKDEERRELMEYRKIQRIVNRVSFPLSKSPEDIIIERERNAKVLHFLLWCKSLLESYENGLWDILKSYIVHGIPLKVLAKKYGVSARTMSLRKEKALKRIKYFLPFYYEEYGNLEEYLKM